MKTISASLIFGFTVQLAIAKPLESVKGEYFASKRGKKSRITLIQKNREFLIHGTSSVSIPRDGLTRRKMDLHDVKNDLDISEVMYESDNMAASLEENNDVRYYSHKSMGSEYPMP